MIVAADNNSMQCVMMVYSGAPCSYAVEHDDSDGICPIMYSEAQHTVMSFHSTVMSLAATTIIVLHRTLWLSTTSIMMLHCTLSYRCYHCHDAPSYTIRHPLPLSGCSTVHCWYLRPPYQSAENHRSFLPSFERSGRDH